MESELLVSGVGSCMAICMFAEACKRQQQWSRYVVMGPVSMLLLPGMMVCAGNV